jgi:type IV secretory pathway VirJ component
MIAALVLAATLVLPGRPPVGTVTVRGRALTVRFYGARSGQPVVLASSDGGWIHLAPHVAEVLAKAGYFVVGFDSKEYLSAFTSGSQTLNPADEPGDVRTFIALAAGRGQARPILIGVSEGAGLAVLAATDAATKAAIAGVLALGLPDTNELGWRWRDAVIDWMTGVPDEPTFSVAGIIDRVAPVPLAAIHSTGDELVPGSIITRIMARAQEPKRLWFVEASDHRFAGNVATFDLRLLEACDWIRSRAGASAPLPNRELAAVPGSGFMTGPHGRDHPPYAGCETGPTARRRP